jgi:hypothetical protein
MSHRVARPSPVLIVLVMLSAVASIHLDAQTAAPALNYSEQTPCLSALQIRIYKHWLKRDLRRRLGVMHKVRVKARQKETILYPTALLTFRGFIECMKNNSVSLFLLQVAFKVYSMFYIPRLYSCHTCVIPIRVHNLIETL